MTHTEFSAQLERFAHAGYRMPDDVSGMAEEWFAALEPYDAERVAAAVTRMIRTRTSSFWPTLGDVLEAVRSELAGRDTTPKGCATCHGTTWIDAVPYRANGGLLYAGVQRCPACGVPAPRHEGPSRQTPLRADEYRDWADTQRPVTPMTYEQMVAKVHQIAQRRGFPRGQNPTMKDGE